MVGKSSEPDRRPKSRAWSPNCSVNAAMTVSVVSSSFQNSGAAPTISNSGSRSQPAISHSPRTMRLMSALIFSDIASV